MNPGRKLIVSMNVTLDGFMSGPSCELDWHFQSWTDEMAGTASEQLGKTDTILLGRITYRAMAKYWSGILNDPSFPREDIDFAQMMNNHRKIVFSKTLRKLEWNNSILINGNIEKEVLTLKAQEGKDMIIYGSGQLVASLIQLGLIDEYRLWVHPVLLGEGKRLFRNVNDVTNMQLINTKTFRSGVVILCYAATRASSPSLYLPTQPCTAQQS